MDARRGKDELRHDILHKSEFCNNNYNYNEIDK